MQEFISKLISVSSELDKYVKKNKDFNKEWDLGLGNEMKELSENTKSQIDLNVKKILRDHKRCVVFGRVGAGKSALINAILGEEILPSSAIATTNGFIQIQKSEDESDYVVFSTNPDGKEQIESLKRVAEFNEHAIEQGSHVNVYLSAQRYPFLRDNLVILDTPGIDSDSGLDLLIQMECRESDLLIFVISANQGFGKTEKNFLLKYKSIYTDYKILVVINCVDTIKEGYAYCKTKLTKEFNYYLRDQLKIEWRSEDAIHFISATERLKIMKNETETLEADFEVKKNAFGFFLMILEKSMKESLENRRLRMIREILTMLDVVLREINSYKGTILKRLIERTQNTFNIFRNYKDEFISKVLLIFGEKEYEKFFVYCLKEVKLKKGRTIASIDGRLKDFTKDLRRKIKLDITDFFRKKYRSEQYVVKILFEIYLPIYFDQTEYVPDKEIVNVRSKCLEINGKNSSLRTIAVGVTAAVVGVSVAGVGIAAGVAVAAPTLVAAPILGAVGLATGTGLGGLTSYISTKTKNLKRFLFRGGYSEEEEYLKIYWNSVIVMLTEC